MKNLGLVLAVLICLGGQLFGQCVPWTPCDDGDPFTIQDKWDDDCNCVGSFVNYDVDNDGVLDYLDNCPITANPDQADADFDGIGDVCDSTPACTPGDDCDDGDPNTINDKLTANCVCQGEFVNYDADNDGVLDFEDNCPVLFNPNQLDSDNDGIGDVCDIAPNCIPWDACDDGDPNTINDKWDDNCNCSGDFVNYDSDNDGVLDYEDNCPVTFNPAQLDSDNDGQGDVCDSTPNPTCTIGASCNDGNPNTINDIFDVNCVCAGVVTITDTDSDGIPDNMDNCPVTFNPDQLDSDNDGQGDVCDNTPPNPVCVPWTPCDDGDPNTIQDKWDDDCNCVGSFVNYDVDNDGILDYLDNCPVTFNPAQLDSDNDGTGDVCDSTPNPTCTIGASCDDGNPNTINDIFDVNCICAGTVVTITDTDSDGIPDNMDNCPVTFNPDQLDSDNDGQGDVCDNTPPNPVCVPWTPCDDGDPNTINDKWDDDCNCVGSFVNYDVDNDGILDYIDNCPITFNPDQLDSDNDGQGDVCDDTPNPTCIIGGPCDDGNPNTTNDIFDVNCNCTGTIIPTCTVGGPCDDGNPNTTNDIFDVNCNCAGTDVPTCTVGGPCDDGNPNTTNDIYDVNCNCAGTAGPTGDIDNDGVIDSKDNCPYFYNPNQEDADDDGLGDVCDPLPNDCHQIYNYTGFEFGWGLWNDGGDDSYRNYEPAVGGNASNYCIRLRDGNQQASSMYTNPLDFSAAATVKVQFMFLPISLEAGENFVLEYSTNGGNQFTEVKSWVSGQNFTNNLFYTDSVIFSGPFTSSTILRFRCNGDTNSDIVYIDEVIISLCVPVNLGEDSDPSASSVTNDNGSTMGFATADSEEADGDTFELDALELEDNGHGPTPSDELSVYPNPVSNELTITGLAEDDSYIIYNLNGQIVVRDQSLTRVNVSNLESGIYLLRTIKGETLRFIKQ